MFKVVAIWSAPADIDGFEQHYLGVHVPKARQVPHLRGLELVRTDKGLEGAPPGFYRLAVLEFDSEGTFHASSESPAWKALREDAGQMLERFGVTLMVALGQDSWR